MRVDVLEDDLSGTLVSYSAEINRANPACLLLLIDQSTSMNGRWTSQNATKAQALSLMVNRLLANSVLLCTKGGGQVYSYFDVGVIGYGSTMGPVVSGTSMARPLINISEVADSPLRVETFPKKVPDGAGGLLEIQTKVPIWVDPVANGGTPMVAGLELATHIIADWCREHRASFPPIVVNITDGDSTDGDPTTAASELRRVSVEDGSALLFNIHLSGIPAREVVLPTDPSTLAEPAAVTLFHASSELPERMLMSATEVGFPATAGSRGFMYNAEATSVIEFLDLGTRAVTPSSPQELMPGRADDDPQ